tara:strand:- start:7 stop:252 length:246 start_codon:yes stop_codon:yes gene_type:complete
MVIFEIYIMNWLQGFYTQWNGPFRVQEEVYNYYQLQGSIGCLITGLFAFPIGIMADSFSIQFLLPASFVFRAFIFWSAYKI